MDTITTQEIDAASLEATYPDDNLLQFRVSTGLKRVLGRELITDDEVAIFELVKNSFDANATEVYIHFGNDSITIADNGDGMSFDDLRNKWLFVAYSSKRNANRPDGQDSYRDEVAEHHQYAGSKGIGRFSSDSLGRLLRLQTSPISSAQKIIHCLDINWDDFEKNDQDQFGQINVGYRENDEFVLEDGIPDREHGTIIQISRLLKRWHRDEILKLKSGLAKLINPFGTTVDGFAITIIAKNEIDADRAAFAKHEKQLPDKRDDAVQVVNGLVGNFIFSTLQQKTTFIDVVVNSESNTIETTLTDRGEVIYRIRENNKYPLLLGAGFRCQLYYLNRAAKATFARRMGLASVQFGSVFLFRNNFRVFPIGDAGDDWFGLDRRKQQGYARYLGTREVIGRIDVSGSDNMFQEASSRNQGLIETFAVAELRNCFWEYCLKRLERYVVPVSWRMKDDIDTLALVESDKGRAHVSAAVADLIGSEGVEVLEYSKRIIDILNERSEQFETSLVNLRVIANSTGDRQLAIRIEEAETRFAELKKSEAEARRIADEERQAKREAEAKAAIALAEAAAAKTAADAAAAEAEAAKVQLGEELKRNLFLVSITSLDIETILDMHHLVTIYAADLQQQIENLMLRMSGKTEIPKDLVVNSLEPIALLNRKVLAVAKFATKANFRIDSEYIEEDLSDYIVSYIEGVAKSFLGGRIAVDITTDGKEFKRKFKPIDISIVVDNLVSNARKARATKIVFDLQQPRKGIIEIKVSDDGKGLSPSSAMDGHLFEKGVTTTDGSGLGLYHVRQVIGDLGGSIEVIETIGRGATFLIRIPI